MKEDAELKQFRELMPAPDHWDEGFGLKAMIGAIFVGLIMTPASMYMQLVIGQDIGAAAQWVTIILFIEVARRSFTVLRRPEIYVLYYMAGASLIYIGPGSLLWNQFLVQSDAFRQLGLANHVPSWVAPTDPDVLGSRSFFHSAWLVPIGLAVLGSLVWRLDHFGLGYIMYRLTSDVERLAFPMAPVGAQGITALADASGGKETWRWRVFSFGGMLGMVFSAIYLGLPSVTSAFLPEPIAMFPLPFKDMTPYTESILPAFPFMLSFNLGFLIGGMVLPFWAMAGSFIGLIILMIANPIMYQNGILSQWRPGVGAVTTINANYLDFYLSFSLGLTAAIAIIGFWHVGSALFRRKRDIDANGAAGIDWGRLFNPPKGRGDFSLWIALGVYVFSTLFTIGTAYIMLDYAHQHGMGSRVSKQLIAVLFFYGFIYTPIISYVGARMEGIVGNMPVNVPFVKEATFILTGYQGAAIWFAPFPNQSYAQQTLYFRQTELTGTKITSMVKAEMFVFPITVIAMIVFSQFIWSIAPVPSAAFPYAEKYWEMRAFQQGVIFTSTMPGGEYGPFYQALQPSVIFAGLGIALALYAGLSFMGLPVLLVYGVIRGLDQSTPEVILPQFLGALLGRYYFARKFGDNWPQYRVVFFAGFNCGMGLVMMLSLGLVFMSKAVFQTTF